MLTLGIETTCDETACAVLNGNQILSNVVYSQAAFHAEYKGVVPELASRHHIGVIDSVLDKALIDAGCSLNDIDLIAVAHGPGLLGSVLVGLNYAKGLSFALKKPFIGVNHVEAHLFASFIDKEIPPMPSLGIVVSGGHTCLLLMSSLGEYQLIGETQDDALGEAFDKVASMLDLPYPGGPAVEKLALLGNPNRFTFSSGNVKGRPFDFSFSGLKTAVLYTLKGQNCTKESPVLLSSDDKKDVAASFQEAALRSIFDKTLLAVKTYSPKSILFGGGVTANQRLRELFEGKFDLPLYWPEKKLSLDNAAMIASLGSFQYKRRGKGDNYDLEAFSRFNSIDSLNRM